MSAFYTYPDTLARGILAIVDNDIDEYRWNPNNPSPYFAPSHRNIQEIGRMIPYRSAPAPMPPTCSPPDQLFWTSSRQPITPSMVMPPPGYHPLPMGVPWSPTSLNNRELPLQGNSPPGFSRNPYKKRRSPNKAKDMWCKFCYNNNDIVGAMQHLCKDKSGRVICDKLRRLVCPTCHATGDEAHTIKYCPKKPIVSQEDTERMESLKLRQRARF